MDLNNEIGVSQSGSYKAGLESVEIWRYIVKVEYVASEPASQLPSPEKWVCEAEKGKGKRSYLEKMQLTIETNN